jgi:protein-S-isoprenylcysteine O-methyltransferase Ste14
MSALGAARRRAAAGSAAFLVLAPGVVAGLAPWLLTGWRSSSPPVWLAVVGWIGIVAGAAVLLVAFCRFVIEGLGTPAPVAPTENLVIGGLYRYVRNPMYLAVLAIILGQALLLGSVGTVLWAVMVLLAVVAFVRLYEEPTLEGEYGDEYREYRRHVRGWLPRLRPWESGDGRG